jgi:hypothetical protein
VKRILVVALMMFVATAALAETPEWSTIELYPKPKAKDYRVAVSNDDWIVAFYDGTVHNIPDVERYAKLYEHVDQHFVSAERNAPVHIYIHTWKKFERSMNKYWPDGAEQLRQGYAVYYAYTYEDKDEKIIVIETYQLLTDNTFIHELLHHYFNRIVRDGSLNQEDVVEQYSYHVEALFRTTLEKEF